MSNIEENQKKGDYKSPTSKLVKFFKNSRDKWKKKYMESKYRAKLLSGQIRYWKEQNADLKLRVKELEKQIESAPKKTRK